MDRLAKVATPATAATVVVPDRVPPPGLVLSATVTLAVEAVRFPSASRMATFTAGVMAAPAVVLVGWTVMASLSAAAGVMLNAVLVAPVRPVALATSV